MIIDQTTLAVEPGERVSLDLRLRNTGSLVERFDVNVNGLPSDWVSLDTHSINIDKGTEGAIAVTIEPSRDCSSEPGPHPFEVVAWVDGDPTVHCTAQATLDVSTFHQLDVRVEPPSSEGRRSARHTVEITNRGNAPIDASVAGIDGTGKIDAFCDPPAITVAAGARASSSVVLRPKRLALSGASIIHTLSLDVRPTHGAASQTPIVMTQTTLAPRWAMRAVTLLIVVLLALGGLSAQQWWQNRPRAMPLVVGMPFEEAESILGRAGFHNIETHQRPDIQSPDLVLEQSPRPPKAYGAKSKVVLDVSSGPTQFDTPDVTRMERSAAEQLLKAQGLRVVVRETRPDSSVATGTVIEQLPAARARIKTGDTVELVVSSGARQVDVPSVVGDLEAQAVSKLQSKGLTWQTRTQPVSNDAQTGRVISQDPAAGSRVPEDTSITITVGLRATP